MEKTIAKLIKKDKKDILIMKAEEKGDLWVGTSHWLMRTTEEGAVKVLLELKRQYEGPGLYDKRGYHEADKTYKIDAPENVYKTEFLNLSTEEGDPLYLHRNKTLWAMRRDYAEILGDYADRFSPCQPGVLYGGVTAPEEYIVSVVFAGIILGNGLVKKYQTAANRILNIKLEED